MDHAERRAGRGCCERPGTDAHGVASRDSGDGREAVDETFDLLEEAASALASAFGEDSGSAGSRSLKTGEGGAATVTVARVIDGDTLEIRPAISGVEDVRLIRVDAPESAIPGEEPQPLGKQAATFTTRELQGEKVQLVLGEEKFDPYRRLLCYATVAGERHTHQEKLLSRGLSQTLFYEPNTAYREEFTALQQQARNRGIGIWGLPHARQCALTDRGNAVGSGSFGCSKGASHTRRSPTKHRRGTHSQGGPIAAASPRRLAVLHLAPYTPQDTTSNPTPKGNPALDNYSARPPQGEATLDERLPAELSLDEIMSGAGCDCPSGLYHTALLDRLAEAGAQAAFTGLDPVHSVIEGLRGYNRLATEEVLSNHHLDAGPGARQHSIVLDVPDTFLYHRYVLTYLQPPPEHRSPIVAAEGRAAKAAWRAERPVFLDTSASVSDHSPLASSRRRSRRKHAAGLQRATSPEIQERAMESWSRADPGRGDYERRIKGFWQLSPVIDYRVRMNFHEDVSILDFHGQGGLMRLYPLGDGPPDSKVPVDGGDPISEVMGSRRRFDPHTGDLSLYDCAEALELAEVIRERFGEAGVICEPDVVLTAPGGGIFEPTLPWVEYEQICAARSAAHEQPTHRELFPQNYPHQHRVLGGLSSAMPEQSTSRTMMRRAESVLLAHERGRELRRRLTDPLIPRRRKEVLCGELAEIGEDETAALEDLGAGSPAVAALLASLDKERELLYEALQLVHGCPSLVDEGITNSIATTMKEIESLRDPNRGYYR